VEYQDALALLHKAWTPGEFPWCVAFGFASHHAPYTTTASSCAAIRAAGKPVLTEHSASAFRPPAATQRSGSPGKPAPTRVAFAGSPGRTGWLSREA